MGKLNITPPPYAYMPWNASTMAVSLCNDANDNWLDMHFLYIAMKLLKDDYNGIITPNLFFTDDMPDNLDNYAIPMNLFHRKYPLFSSFLKQMIDMQYYIFVYLDTYYIPTYWTYKNQHKIHPVLVYGYQDNTFYISDFFRDGKYSFEECTAIEIDKGISHLINQCESLYDWEKDFNLIKPKPSKANFNINIIKSALIRHLSSVDSEGRNSNHQYAAFGIDIYKYINDYLERMRHSNENLDYRMFNCILVHKKLMLKKVKRLSMDNDKFSNALNGIKFLYDLSVVNQSLALKYNLVKKEEYIDSMQKNLDTIYKQEEIIFKEIVNLI